MSSMEVTEWAAYFNIKEKINKNNMTFLQLQNETRKKARGK